VRFGLVTFTDSQIGVQQPLTRNVSEFERSLDNVGVGGGTEYNYDALDTALGMNYRSNAQKVVIDITDEDANRGSKTQQDISQEIQQRGISYIAVSPDFGHGAATTTSGTATVTDESGATISSTAEELDKAVLASKTGGQWYDIASPDFSNVLTNVTSSLSSTYVVRHESTIPRANASNRTVTVTVDDPNAGVGSDTGQYVVSQPSQPQPASAQVKLSPNKKTVAVGDTTTYDIVVTETQSQIGAYNYTVNTTNVSNATITDFAFAGSPITKSVTFASDDSSVTVDATQASVPSGTDVVIGTVTVEAASIGATNLSVGVNDIVDPRGNAIPINKTLDSSLAISQGTSQTLRFDPVTQTTAPGTTTTFDLIVPNASSGISTYDYTIRTNDSLTANITAVQPGGSPASSTLNIDYAPDNSSVTVTGGFAKIAPGTNVSIGTVTVSGVANGTAELSARVGPVIDANNSAVAIAGAERATVKVDGSRVSAPGDLTGNGQAATDPDNDGVYEDINGDGSADLRDLQPFFDLVRPSASTPQTSALDMNGDGQVGLRDLQPFFNEVRP
jgi:hypothetical protein